MIKSGKLTALLPASIYIIGASGVNACATADHFSDPVEAFLLNTQDGPTRQVVRVFVRDTSGPDLIADPDSLGDSPKLIYNQRVTNRKSATRSTFQPYGDYKLILDSNNRCWLIHMDRDATSQVELPPSASCAAYKPG